MNYKSLLFSKVNLTKEQHEVFHREYTLYNFTRTTIGATVLFMINLISIYIDYNYWHTGAWNANESYKYLFYMHLLLQLFLGMLIILSSYFKNNINLKLKWYSVYNLFFTFFVLIFSVIISGAIDQLIHNQISVFIIAIFALAITNCYKPPISLVLYFTAYVIFGALLFEFQTNESILIGNLINGTIAVLLAWICSLFHYYMKTQDFLSKNLLEKLVQERTSQLNSVNQQLQREIDERKQFQAKIERLASIVEHTDDGILGMTPEGVILDWNVGASRIYGYSENEIIGKKIYKLVPPERHLEVKNILERVSKGEKIRHFETIRRNKEGRLIYVSLTVSPIADEKGTIIGASTIIRDISEVKQMEHQMLRLSQLNLIGEMAAGISHEVRNPMTTVMGFLQLLGEKEAFVSYRNYFKLMIDELNRANSIITEFLSIGNTRSIELERHNISTIVQTLFPLIEADAIRSEKTVNIETEEVPDLLINDKEIRQVILNLSRNGLEAMNAGGLLTIRTYEADDQVVLAIQDQGKGIDPSILEKLGTPFLTTKDNGTGLGMAVCFGIAARNKAVITVETSTSGTTFFVKFKNI